MKRLSKWMLPILWMLVIFYLSHQAASQSSDLSSGLTTGLVGVLSLVLPFLDLDFNTLTFFVRKAAHFMSYLILGVLIIRALNHGYSSLHFKRMMLALIVSCLYAMSDELHQLFIPGRSGEIRDVFIDTTGALVGIYLYRLFFKYLGRYYK